MNIAQAHKHHTDPVVLRAALEMAGRSIHVLPVKEEKAPLTAHVNGEVHAELDTFATP